MLSHTLLKIAGGYLILHRRLRVAIDLLYLFDDENVNILPHTLQDTYCIMYGSKKLDTPLLLVSMLKPTPAFCLGVGVKLQGEDRVLGFQLEKST